MLTFRILMLAKLAGVMLFGGGTVSALVATSAAERRRAVHRIAAPGLAVTWIVGFMLASQLGVSWTELWIVGAAALSVVTKVALVRCLSRDEVTRLDKVATVVPFLAAMALMIFRPTWESLRS